MAHAPGRHGLGGRHLATVLCLSLGLTLLPQPAATNGAVPSGFTESLVVSGLSSPTAMAFAPDGRLFVAQQGGQLRVIRDGALLAAPFLTVTVSSVGERGLLGIAFDPAFTTNGYVYVYYTATTPTIHNRISRFTAAGDAAVAGSEVVILELDDLSGATNHNGGALHFGPDGKLYVAVGENANGAHAQTLANLLGKMLRINADGSIPSDNPFFTSAAGRNRAIWALGLRNPFTFAFQRGSSRMFINDVGQSTWEEVNDGVAGANYGWPQTEGPTSDPRYRSPVYSYRHLAGECAITGGTFYNPQTVQFPADHVGDYFFADYCSGWIRRFDVATGTATDFASGIASPVDLQVSTDGSLYYLARGTSSVYRIRYTGGQAPTIGTHPVSRTVSVGQSATFSVAASGTPPIAYQWQRNGVNIAGATGTSYTIASAQLSDSGAQFRAIASNAAGTATSTEATLTVTANAAPIATITQPASGALYSAGQTVSFAGTGSDAEDGTLGANRFTWQVDFHHDAHTHPFLAAATGSMSGSFVPPTTGHTESNVWYRIHLTVRDSAGNANSTFRDVRPRTATITLATNPTGLQLRLDSQPITAPYTFTGVAGVQRSLQAVQPQVVNGVTMQFASWSDGGGASHVITTPASPTTFTATYASAPNLLQNGSFESTSSNWFSPWIWRLRAPAEATMARDASTPAQGTYSVRVSVTRASTDWYVQVMQANFRLEAGVPHTLSFWARSSINRNIRVAFQHNAAPHTLYFQQTRATTTAWQRHVITFTPSTTDANALLNFNLGNATGQVWIDDVMLTR